MGRIEQFRDKYKVAIDSYQEQMRKLQRKETYKKLELRVKQQRSRLINQIEQLKRKKKQIHIRLKFLKE